MKDDANDSLFDPAQIKAILTVAQTGSFSRAADELGVTQPTISMQVRKAEIAIGRPLFARRRAGVRLTREGEAVIVYARALMALNADLRRQLRNLSGAVRISLGTPDDFSRTALASVLSLFVREHPFVEMRVIAGTYEPLSKVIEAGGVGPCRCQADHSYPKSASSVERS